MARCELLLLQCLLYLIVLGYCLRHLGNILENFRKWFMPKTEIKGWRFSVWVSQDAVLLNLCACLLHLALSILSLSPSSVLPSIHPSIRLFICPFILGVYSAPQTGTFESMRMFAAFECAPSCTRIHPIGVAHRKRLSWQNISLLRHAEHFIHVFWSGYRWACLHEHDKTCNHQTKTTIIIIGILMNIGTILLWMLKTATY